MRHPARIKTSVRLQKVLAILSDKEWHSTYDIMQITQLCAVGSAISELRANGFIVDCRLGKEIDGDKYYEYQIQGAEAVAGEPSPIGQAEHSPCMRHVEAVAPDIITSSGRQSSKPASRAPIIAIQEALF